VGALLQHLQPRGTGVVVFRAKLMLKNITTRLEKAVEEEAAERLIQELHERGLQPTDKNRAKLKDKKPHVRATGRGALVQQLQADDKMKATQKFITDLENEHVRMMREAKWTRGSIQYVQQQYTRRHRRVEDGDEDM